MAIEEKIIDKRIVKRSLRKGLVEAKDLDGHLADLPDLSDQVHVPSQDGSDGTAPTE